MNNLLPYGGNLNYIPDFIEWKIQNILFKQYKNNLNWQQDQYSFQGKIILSPRLIYLMGEPKLNYNYSNLNHSHNAFNKNTLFIKNKIEQLTNSLFNSCLFNYYRSGNDSIAYHTDNEKELGINPVIAGLSLGNEREIRFKHNKTNEVIKLLLEPGSLFIMSEETQIHWKHSIPKIKDNNNERISLTFRNILL